MLRYQSPFFELPITMEVQKASFQNREDGVNFRKAEAQVYVVGTRDPTMFLQETYIGSIRYTFQN